MPKSRAALRHCLPPLRDEVRPSALAEPAPWNALPLRPYNEPRCSLGNFRVGAEQSFCLRQWQNPGRHRCAGLRWRALPCVSSHACATRAVDSGATSSLSRPCGLPSVMAAVTCRRFTVSTYESAYRLMPRIGAEFELLVVDEAHHFGMGVRDGALEMSTPQRLGLDGDSAERARAVAFGRADWTYCLPVGNRRLGRKVALRLRSADRAARVERSRAQELRRGPAHLCRL